MKIRLNHLKNTFLKYCFNFALLDYNIWDHTDIGPNNMTKKKKPLLHSSVMCDCTTDNTFVQR